MKNLMLKTLTIFLIATIFSGCGAKPKPQKNALIDTTLPVLEINGYLADSNAVAFEWKEIKDTRVKGVYIYKRSLNDPKSKRLKYYDSTVSRFVTHYTDYDIKPSSKYQYTFSTYKDEDSQSKATQIESVTSKPLINSVSYFESIGNMPRSAKLIWRPHTNPSVVAYEIKRRGIDDREFKTIARPKGRLTAEYIDLDLKDNQSYNYVIYAVQFNKMKSKPSKTIKVVTKPLPVEITGLNASLDLPHKISVSWNQSQQDSISHYNLYRSSSKDGRYKYHVKTEHTTFIDKIDENGKVYYYKVTSTDKDNLEGELNDIGTKGMTLELPTAPVLQTVTPTDDKIILKWKSLDDRAKSYKILKSIKGSWSNEVLKPIVGIKGLTYTDNDVKTSQTYIYSVVAIDKNKIESKPSNEVKSKESN